MGRVDGKIGWVVESDCEPEPDFDAEHFEMFLHNPACFSPRLLLSGQQARVWAKPPPYSWNQYEVFRHRLEMMDWAVANAMNQPNMRLGEASQPASGNPYPWRIVRSVQVVVAKPKAKPDAEVMSDAEALADETMELAIYYAQMAAIRISQSQVPRRFEGRIKEINRAVRCMDSLARHDRGLKLV